VTIQSPLGLLSTGFAWSRMNQCLNVILVDGVIRKRAPYCFGALSLIARFNGGEWRRARKSRLRSSGIGTRQVP